MSRTAIPLPLRNGRTHEVCGPGAPAFAAVAGAQTRGAVLWVGPRHAPERLMPVGLARFFSPARLLVACAANETDLLWMAEEGLRSGAVGLVVAALTKPLALTPGRRLQLAAETGRATGLCLVREGAGSNVAETRWRCAPEPAAPDSTLYRWSLIKNKSGTIGEWWVLWDDEARRIRVVSPSGERSRPAPASG